MKKLKTQAARIHTHRVIFTADDDVECACRALLGQSNRAIARATGLSEGQVQYRVSKATIRRWDFRHGESALAQRMIGYGRRYAAQQVETDIAPRFARFASK